MEFPQFPTGVYFHPTPHDCILFLTAKVTSAPLPLDGVVFDLDPYNLKQLPDIFSTVLNRGELYLFTKLRRKGKSGGDLINADRKVGRGTWHGDRTRPVTNDRDPRITVGKAQIFNYRETGSLYHGRFIMTEYTLLKGTSLDYDPLKDFVLCHIAKKSRGRRNGQRVCISFEPEVVVPAANSVSSAAQNPSTSSSSAAIPMAPSTPVFSETQHVNLSPALQDMLEELFNLSPAQDSSTAAEETVPSDLCFATHDFNDEEIQPLDHSWNAFFNYEEMLGLL